MKPKVKLAVNGKSEKLKLKKGFAQITRKWKDGDIVTLDLEMPVRKVIAHPEVKADRDRFAIERGPLVYCAEGADNNGSVLDRVPGKKVRLETAEQSGLAGKMVTIIMVPDDKQEKPLTLIPYYYWCHRGPNEMRVWFPTKAEVKLFSHCWERDSVEACFDGKEPKSSADQSIPRFTFWPHKGSQEWVLNQFPKARKISSTSVYWFDDTGSGECRIPNSWQVLYLDGKEWKPVAAASGDGVTKNQFNKVTFAPVTTTALKLEVDLQDKFSAGILEWKAE